MSDFSRIERGFINLRGNADQRSFAEAAAKVLGLDLPTTANTTTASIDGTNRVYWLGPNEWLVGAARSRVAALIASLEEALAGQTVAINDLSGGLVLTELPDKNSRELLARGCTADLRTANFGAGDCAQTTLAKANILLACIDDAPVYEIIVRRSFSEYVLRWLRQTHLSLVGSAFSS